MSMNRIYISWILLVSKMTCSFRDNVFTGTSATFSYYYNFNGVIRHNYEVSDSKIKASSSD